MIAVNAVIPASSIFIPSSFSTMVRWPVLETGRNSVTPSTMPRMSAWSRFMWWSFRGTSTVWGYALAERTRRRRRTSRYSTPMTRTTMPTMMDVGGRVATSTRQPSAPRICSAFGYRRWSTVCVNAEMFATNVVEQHPEGGESDRSPQVDREDKDAHDHSEGDFGVVRHLVFWVHCGEPGRQVLVARHGKTRAANAGDQGQQGAESGRGCADSHNGCSPGPGAGRDDVDQRRCRCR